MTDDRLEAGWRVVSRQGSMAYWVKEPAAKPMCDCNTILPVTNH